MFKSVKIKIELSLIISLVLFSLVSILVLIEIEKDKIEESVRKEIILVAKSGASDIGREFDVFMERNQGLAQSIELRLSQHRFSREKFDKIFEEMLISYPELVSAWMISTKNELDRRDFNYRNTSRYGKSGAYSIWLQSFSSKGKRSFINEPFGMVKKSSWLRDIEKHKGLFLLEPFKHLLSSGDSVMLISAGAPIEKKGYIIGYCGTEIPYKHIEKILGEMSFFKNDYVSLVSPDNKYIFHPKKDLIGSEIKFNTAEGFEEKFDSEGYRYRINSSDYLKQKVYEVFFPIYTRHSTSPWYLSVSVPIKIIEVRMVKYVSKLIIIFSIACLVLILLLGYIISYITKPVEKMVKRIHNMSLNKINMEKVKPIKVQGKDETFILAESYNNFINNHRVLQELKQKLTDSELKLKQFVEESHVGTYDIYLDDKLLVGSPMFYKTLGLSKDEPRAFENFFAHIHEDDRESIYDLFRQSRAGKREDFVVNDFRFNSPEKGLIWIRNCDRVYSRNIHGKGGRQVGHIQDITEEKLNG